MSCPYVAICNNLFLWLHSHYIHRETTFLVRNNQIITVFTLTPYDCWSFVQIMYTLVMNMQILWKSILIFYKSHNFFTIIVEKLRVNFSSNVDKILSFNIFRKLRTIIVKHTLFYCTIYAAMIVHNIFLK